ncbi:unnamed protein product [Brassicogethes aeneus]|uniref:Uncharacterized protein n=1 Tax=Brassicogethes aeneus TaxID=1431903 RepID=A0A9P0AXN2_BRAAE|nr:unnamed protein product [Brassicogethes aeneus]
MLHSPQDYPGDGAIFKMVAKGRQTDLQILGTQLKCSPGVWSLPVEQRQCVSPEEVEPLFFHEKYADTNCLTECDAKYFIEACNCVPFYFYFSGINVCNMKQINCLNNATKEKNLEESRSKCYCPSECEDYDYKILSTSTEIQLTDSIENPLM